VKDQRVLCRVGLDGIGGATRCVRWVDMIRHAAAPCGRIASRGGKRSPALRVRFKPKVGRRIRSASSHDSSSRFSTHRTAWMHRTKQQLDLLDLFPAASTSTSAPVLVDAPSVAFVGQLPAATPLHLALNHLRREEEDKLEDERLEGGLSERARGKQRAEADVFQGDEEVHSPGDDAQSRARQSTMTAQRRVLILTPDRDALREQLVEQCDGSLVGDRLDGSEQALLDRIDIR
jgi:hypothetical protein